MKSIFCKYFLSLNTFLLLNLSSFSQHQLAGSDAWSTGTNAFQENAWAVLNCSSNLADSLNQIAISSNNYYNINSLYQHTIVSNFSKSKFKFGMGIDYFSSPAINSSRFVFVNSHKIGLFKIGTSIERWQYFVNEYDSRGKWSVALSGNANFNQKISIALQINDLLPSKNLEANNNSFLWIALKFNAFKNLYFISQINGYQNDKPTLNISSKWIASKFISIKFGTENTLLNYYSGFDIKYKNLTFQYSLKWMPSLGSNNGIGLLFQW